MFQMPLKTTPIYWITFASIKLLVIFLMILQLELTISWNNISGLSKMNTPGQFDPSDSRPVWAGQGLMVQVAFGDAGY